MINRQFITTDYQEVQFENVIMEEILKWNILDLVQDHIPLTYKNMTMFIIHQNAFKSPLRAQHVNRQNIHSIMYVPQKNQVINQNIHVLHPEMFVPGVGHYLQLKIQELT